MRSRGFMVGFTAALLLFIIANLVAVHMRSEAGLLEGLGIIDRSADDIRRIGFPFQFFEEGGFAHRRIFNLRALHLDIVVAVISAGAVGFMWSCSFWRLNDEKA